jgi:hypothetical protein
VQAYENVLIVACELAIIGNGLAILVCLSAIQSETEKLKETIRNLK